MSNLKFLGCQFLKKGSGIHIKEENRGKFTASAKKVGESVQEHASNVLDNPKATTLQKKRAQFAKNAKKWKHIDGAKIHNLDIVTGNKKKMHNRSEIHQTGGRVRRVNWKNLAKDPEYVKNYNWRINPNNMKVVEDSLINRGAKDAQRIAAFSQIIPESGGETKPHGNGAHGLIGWRGDRAKGLSQNLPKQTHKLMEGLFNSQAANWNHGGKGTNVNTGKEMQQLYQNSPNVKVATKAVMKGFVRPGPEEWDKRVAVTGLIKKHMY